MGSTLSFHFANSEDRKLPFLTEEDDGVYAWLAPENGKAYSIDRVSVSRPEAIGQTVTNHRDSLWLFHYSGHAGGDHLLIAEEALRGEGIGHQLAQCPNLTVIMLNGCATRGQVEALLETSQKGKPRVIIATSAEVDDRSAKDFSIRFYEALSKQATISEAFEIAVGEVQQRQDVAIKRGLVLDAEEPQDELNGMEAGIWGLFYLEEQAEVLGARLPGKMIQFEEEIESDFLPNDYFLGPLWEAFKEAHPEIRALDEKGRDLIFSEKVTALYKYLAAPLAECLRKLLVPSGMMGEGEILKGYDKINYDRLGMLLRTYRVASDLVAFTILTQLWEAKQRVPGFAFTSEIRETINHFMTLSREGREVFRYTPFLKQAQSFLVSLQSDLFIAKKEADEDETENAESTDTPLARTQAELTYYHHILRHTREFLSDHDFYDAAIYLEIYNERLKQDARQKGAWTSPELFLLCERAEYHLSKILQKLGLFLKYTMATSKAIEVRKDRSIKQARFNHRLVRLTHITGPYGEVEMSLEDSLLDSKSVVLMERFSSAQSKDEQDPAQLNYLSFSPFILDRNAFEENGELAWIYFFHHYDAAKQSYLFYHLRNPVKDKMLEVKMPAAKREKGRPDRPDRPDRPGRPKSGLKDPYQPVWEQFESFRKIFA